MSRDASQRPFWSGEETAVSMYLRDIQQYPLLTPAEEQKLARRARRGDREARERMIQSNLRLVVSIAKNFMGRGIPLMDIIEEGNLGLITAVKKFDPRKHYKFSTYATWWIKQRIKRLFQEASRSLRLPRTILKFVTDYRNSYASLEARYGRAPLPGEMAREMNLSTKQLQAFMRAVRTFKLEPQSIARLSDGFCPEDVSDDITIRPEKRLISSSENELIRKLLTALSDKEAAVLQMRFGLDTDQPMTLAQVGRRFGITRERARQIEKTALSKLHRILSKHPDYSEEIRKSSVVSAEKRRNTTIKSLKSKKPKKKPRGPSENANDE